MIIPETLRLVLLDELHQGHVGIVKMKNVARSYVWWPCIDRDIENLARNCDGCLQMRSRPSAVVLHPWQLAEQPWLRIHVDFAEPFMQSMFLIVMDTFSKWPEVVVMNSTTTVRTIDELRVLFSCWGLPEQIVSDNGPQFKSEELEIFLRSYAIAHLTTPPYFPASNGQAERFVQTMKNVLTAAKSEAGSLEVKLLRFLLAYRNAPHALLNESPVMLFSKRSSQSFRFDSSQSRGEGEKKNFKTN